MLNDRLVDLEELKKYDNKPIGVFGARASGKTMFFTVLYGLSGYNNEKEKFSVVCSEPESRAYLKKNYKYLLDGKLPPRTELDDITKINMNYFYNQNNYLLKSFDFPGELLKDIEETEEVNDGFLVLQEKIYSFFANCSGILIFIEPSESKKESFNRQTEVDKLLGFLKDYKGKWDFNIPMALVITKWDKVSGDLTEAVPKFEEEKVEDFVKNHSIYSNIYSLIMGVSENVKIFPVSAFGEAKDNDLPPDELKPFNLFNPLIWVSQKRDIEWKERIETVFSRNIGKKDAGEIYNVFIENVENKELISEVKLSYERFSKKKNLQLTAIITIIVLILAGMGINGRYRKNLQFKYKKDIFAEMDLKTKIDKIEEYLELYGEKRSEDIILEKVTTLESVIFSDINPSFKLQAVDKLLLLRPNHKDKDKYIKEKEYLRYEILRDSDYRKLEERLKTKESDIEKYRLYISFIRKYPSDSISERLRVIAAKHIKKADRDKYGEIEKLSLSESRDNKKLLNEIDDYLAEKDFVEYKKTIKDLKENIIEEDLYLEVKKTLELYNKKVNLKNLKNLKLKIDSYLTYNKFGRYIAKFEKMRKDVERVLNGKKVEISVFIKEGNLNVKNKEVELRIEVENTDKLLYKKIGNKNNVYIGSLDSELRLDSKIKITLYLLGDNKETTFEGIIISGDDLNQWIKTDKNEVSIKIEVDENNFKIK